MSDGHDIQESQRIGGKIVCLECGIPKRPEEYAEGSAVCHRCVPRTLARQKASVSREDLNKTRFDIAIEELRESGDPALAMGVRRAHQILGKTSTEIIAGLIRETCLGIAVAPDGTEVPSPKADFKTQARFLELFQRAELKHDEALKGENPYKSLNQSDIESVVIDSFLEQMIESRDKRLRVLRILKDRCPDILGDMMEVCEIDVLEGVP